MCISLKPESFAKPTFLMLCLILLVGNVMVAATDKEPLTIQAEPQIQIMPMIDGNSLIAISEPVYFKIEPLGRRTITAYSSTPEQTDDTPLITASGETVRDGIVATNELPFGQKIMIEGIDKIFEVVDRTNKRYNYRIDIWLPTTDEALRFGRQELMVFLVK